MLVCMPCDTGMGCKQSKQPSATWAWLSMARRCTALSPACSSSICLRIQCGAE